MPLSASLLTMVPTIMARVRNLVYLSSHHSKTTGVEPSPQAKCCQSQEQEMGVDHTQEPATQRQREENPLLEKLAKFWLEAFCKVSELIQHMRQTYFQSHPLSFHKEDAFDLTEVFRELAEKARLLGTEIHLVQDLWEGKNELHSVYYMVRGSAKDLHFFRVVTPLESPKIMGLRGIHSPEVLKRQVGLCFCPWCGKKGQNEGTIINHICTRYYCLELVCKRCLCYFTTTSDKVQWHTQACMGLSPHKNNQDGEVDKFA